MNPIFHPYVVTAFVTSIVTIGVGLFVYFKDRHSAIHGSFLCFSAAICQWSFFTALQGIQQSPVWGLFWGRFCHIGGLFIPVFFYYFTLKITGKEGKKALTLGSLFALAVTVLIFTTPYFIPRSRTDVGPAFLTEAGPLYFLMIIFFVSYVLMGLAKLWQEIQRSRGARRKHLQYFFLASAAGFGVGIFNFFPVYGLTVPPYPYSPAAGALYSCVIAYAILRHKLFDIELMIKKGMIFGVLFGIVYAAVSMLIFLVGYAFAKLPASLLSGISIALAMFLYEPLKRLLTALTNRFLFQKKASYTALIQTLTDNLANTRDVGQLADGVAHFLTDHMGLEWAAFFIRDDENKWFRLRGGVKTVPFERLKEDHPIIELIQNRRVPLILSPFDVDTGLRADIKLELRRDKIEAIVPIFLEGKLYGVLLLGKKKSDDAYSKEDEALLYTLMDEAAMFFLSAKLLKEATRSNLELGQRMKMTAVTKLARGVHHEVRNPLHEIELSAKATLEEFTHPRWKSMSQEDLAREIDGYLANILSKVDRIKDSLGRFASFARPEEDFELATLSLRDELEKFITLMRDAHKLDKIKVHNHIPDETYIYASEGALQEICFNLFNNAYEAMHGQGELTLSAESNGAFVALRIRDTGNGIAEENINRIFEPYFTTKTNLEAVGIGLTIARYHALRLGGAIEAFSTPGRGAELAVSLRKAEKREEITLCEAS